MPKVSFVLPAFKRRFLKEAIESILAQTYKDFELIVVDDHSPENLKEVVNQFSDPRLTYHYNEQNIGGKDLVAAWTHAMSFAKGEWCVLASDDDLYHSQYLKEMVYLSEKHPNISAVHSRVAVINSEGSWIGLSEPRKEIENEIEMQFCRGISRCQQTMPDFMFRRDALAKIGGFVKFPLAWYTDDATWTSLAGLGGVAYTSRVLFYFRNSGENISFSNAGMVDKIHSSYLYYRWVIDKFSSAKSCSPEEDFMLRSVKELQEDRCLKMVNGLLQCASLLDLVRILSCNVLPLKWKIYSLKTRLIRLIDIRRS